MNRAPIVLTTDFGLEDPYVGVMKGVIYGINPEARIIDHSHYVEPQNIAHGSMLLSTSYNYFPDHTIHISVVDPGVGTERSALIIMTPRAYLVGPDNGLFSGILGKYSDDSRSDTANIHVPAGCKAFRITNSEVFLTPTSDTFHGRDIFAPVGAHLSLGATPSELGDPVESVLGYAGPDLVITEDRIVGEVIYVDHFGNLITNISNTLLTEDANVIVEMSGSCIRSIHRTFNDGNTTTPNEPIALLGSNGYLEIAVPNGHASRSLLLSSGDQVILYKSH
ncbi:MAG: S-adenosyl-l-methionine hydroxide adenosyltransferase [SAR202 cluster bacterium]|nr:MAG: S-adenosyl-l-methionine hydroxide adenosyltransferase [SAR202 cluster bacterium]